MKRVRVGLWLLIVACGVLVLEETTGIFGKKDSAEAAGAMSESDPRSKLSLRKAFEFERLKDPATGAIPPGIRASELRFAKRLPRKADARGLSWIPRGPFNVGGRTRALALDVLDENILLAGGVTGGMWRSENGGESWVKTTDPDQIHSVNCLVQDTRPGHENTWYYGTGEEFYGVVSGTSFTSLFSGDGMFKSVDGGQSWSPIASTVSGTPQSIQDGTYDYVWKIIVDTQISDQDVVLAAVYNGIIRSVDGGDSWEQVLGFNASPSVFTDLMQTPEGVFYAVFSADGLGRGVFRSTDGLNWTQLDFPPGGLYRRIVMTYNPQDENEVYFLLEGPSSQNSIGHAFFKYTYLSGDGSGEGGTWEDRSGNLPQTPCVLFIGSEFDFGTFGSQNSYDLCLSHHPTEEDVLFIGGRNIFRTNNAFASQDQTSWIGGYRCNVENPRDYVYPNHHPDQHLMIFSPSDPSVMFSANDGGVHRTDNCLADSVQWISLNNGYITTQFYAVAMEQGLAESDFVMGGMQDNGTWGTGSIVLTDNWKEVHNDDGAYCAIPEGMDFVVSSSQLGRMYKKELDEDGNIVNAKRIDPTNGPSSLFINPFILDPRTHNDIYIGGGTTLWHLDSLREIELDGNLLNAYSNQHWENVSASFVTFSGGNISSMDIPYVDHSVMYYGTTLGRIWKLENLQTNPVKTEITANDFPNNAWMSSIAVNDLNRDEVVISFSNYGVISIWRSTDGGENWESISGNLEENSNGSGSGPAVYSVEVYPSDPPVYFAATSIGLFSTELPDGMNTVWEMEGPDVIGNVIGNMVKARPYDGTIVLGTHGNGIYSSSLDPVAAVGIEEPTQPRFAVQAWPNPMENVLNVEFEVAQAAGVEFSVFDAAGKRIHWETRTAMSAGVQRLSWNVPADLPNGYYTYSLQLGELVRRGKLIRNKP